MSRMSHHAKIISASLITTAVLLSVATTAQANADLAKAKNCLACHDVAAKKIGPSYKDVAAKYAKDASAEAKLAKKIREGGTGVWNMGVMPPNPQVTEAEAKTLAKWIMSQK